MSSYFSENSWSEFAIKQGIDARLAKAIPSLRIERPTMVQERAGPVIISGKDALIKSPTGTGKTLAYVIPLLQRLIITKDINPLSLVILVPTKELCAQVFSVCSGLLTYLFDSISVDAYTGEDKYRRPSLPTVMITTARGLVSLCRGSGLGSEAKHNIRYIAVDEADLVLSQGFEKDIRTIVSVILPKEYQAVLVSATLTDDLETLKGLMLRNPMSVIIEDSDIGQSTKPLKKKKAAESGSSLVSPASKQFYQLCPSRDKFLCLYAFIKLQIVSGKILIFTSTVDSAYKLKIFFDKFAVGTAVFNSEMPLECRHRVLSAFNDGLFKILIASEETNVNDPEAAAHRGIDFSNVNCVFNFDAPSTVANYVHRAGRTARGGKSGIVVSFVDPQNPREVELIEKVGEQRDVSEVGIPVSCFEQLRYRVEDVTKGISRRAVAAARQKEILNEMLHNEKLKQRLSENSDDVQALRQAMRTLREHSKVKWHLREIPEYLLPDLQGVKPLVAESGAKPNDDVMKTLKKRRREEEEGAVKRPKKTLREKMLKRDDQIDPEMISPDELAPISGRKLWKVQHHKKIKRVGDSLGKPPRIARKLWKSAKKFT
jgi:ATP-dependent RNA helicase DDX56/DBP9